MGVPAIGMAAYEAWKSLPPAKLVSAAAADKDFVRRARRGLVCLVLSAGVGVHSGQGSRHGPFRPDPRHFISPPSVETVSPRYLSGQLEDGV